MESDFDIVVVGGGHAGVEAAHAAARCGARTALVTLRAETIGQMSCNPAIGGIGKGQIVREVDALGGLMGLAADATGIQFRMLNRGKGPAVWGPRCQSDRHAYAAYVQAALRERPNLTVLAGEVTGVVAEQGRAVGVRYHPAGDDGFDVRSAEGAPLERELRRPGRAGNEGRLQQELRCRAVIITAGTFLGGLMHLGEQTWTGGRYGEDAARGLTASLRAAGLESGRLKTGTCPRIAAGSIDYSACTRQDGDVEPAPFSFLNTRLEVEQIPCWITQTTPKIHELVKANLHRAPMFSGQIQSTGPRYCPSFETKIVRFPEKTSHQVFLEPEGRSTDWVYVNGIPTSLPVDVQRELVRGIPGLRKAEVLRWGYAIEYDFFPPTQLAATLEAKATPGLYLAGQVNGTTGYEEAAGQGLLAGLNAAAALAGREPLVLRRSQAYIGVMIDDLVTKGVSEPYRMFTSRAEHRLTLRADNADARLTPIGRAFGLVDDDRWRAFGAGRAAADTAERLLRETRRNGRSLWELLQRPEVTAEGLAAEVPQLARLLGQQPAAVASRLIDAKYAGYVAKEHAAMRHMEDLDTKPIPPDLDYTAVRQLRHEARQRLSDIRPRTLGQALRVSGITPADITVLLVHMAARK